MSSRQLDGYSSGGDRSSPETELGAMRMQKVFKATRPDEITVFENGTGKGRERKIDP